MDERKKVVEDVDKDRRYAIDAAIVRIMKSRKVLGHQQLVSECVEQLSRMFKVFTHANPLCVVYERNIRCIQMGISGCLTDVKTQTHAIPTSTV